MRVGIDIRATQLGSGTRGIGKYVYELITGVMRLAPDNDYVLGTLPDYPLPGPIEALPISFRIVPLPTTLLTPWHRLRRGQIASRLYHDFRRGEHRSVLARFARRECLDVLHLTALGDRSFFATGRFPCRTICTLYDLTPLVLRDIYYDRWSWDDQYVYGRQIDGFRQADAVVAISESARQDGIRLLGLRPEKVSAIWPALPREFTATDSGTDVLVDLGRYGITCPYFLFCSTLSDNKNWERLIAAFGRFAARTQTRYQLVLAGHHGQDSLDQIAKYASAAGLAQGQVIVTGYVPDADLAALFRGALALATPSLYEGFGLPAAQAMLLGTPVIASDRSSLPEVVGDAGLLVDPYDEEAIAGALLSMAEDPALRSELAARGRERVRLFDWRRQAEAMLRVYEGLSPVSLK